MKPCLTSDSRFRAHGNTSNANLLTSTDEVSRICIVHRFWRENEEKSRHVFWIPRGFSMDKGHDHCWSIQQSLHTPPLCEKVQERYLEVQYINRFRHTGVNAVRNSTALCSVGILPAGVSGWGFQFQGGNKASGEGIYMLCLYLPLRSRASPNAVRIQFDSTWP